MTFNHMNVDVIISLRPVEVNDSDLNKLQKIGHKTFSETFLPFNSVKAINLYLKNKFNKEQLIAEILNIDSLFYFAEIDNRVVGYLKVNSGEAQTEQIVKDALEIERIYVLSEFHGKGIGKRLFERAVEIAVKKNKKTIWLGVWKQNKKAIRFYEKNGFVEFDEHIFLMGHIQQVDSLMKVDLVDIN